MIAESAGATSVGIASTRIRNQALRRAGGALAVIVAVLAVTVVAVAAPPIEEPVGVSMLQPAERLEVAPSSLVSDDFDGSGSLIGYTTNNPDALPDVGRLAGRYRAVLTDNTGNRTLHFNESQGRLDAKLVSFPFDYIARNIGIGTIGDSQTAPEPVGSPFMFAGVQVHALDLDVADSAHVVVGHRGGTHFTVEGKNTVAGNSSVNDAGADIVPDGRADIRIVGNADRTLTVYWQRPNLGAGPDAWQLYRGSGQLPGAAVVFGPTVYVGLITYAFETPPGPFVGTADAVQLVGE